MLTVAVDVAVLLTEADGYAAQATWATVTVEV
jgi:hypothetical protein